MLQTFGLLGKRNTVRSAQKIGMTKQDQRPAACKTFDQKLFTATQAMFAVLSIAHFLLTGVIISLTNYNWPGHF